MPRAHRPRVNGDALSALRSARGFTQKDLGAASNISDSYISDLELGKRRGNESVAAALAEALKVNVAALLVLDAAKDAA